METNFENKSYEEKCEIIKEENERMLELFEASMEGLKPKTIERHLFNVDFFLNNFLMFHNALPFREGMCEVDDFLGYFFIRKCMWSTPASIKTTAASIKKFYKCMMDNGLIPKPDYEELCVIIKERMPDWQEDCAVYNDPEQESPFFMW